MNWYEAIVIAFLFYGIFDRLREIAQWDFWSSVFGNWLDTYNEKGPKWFPFRDAYHTFKNIPVYTICIIVGYYAGWQNGLYAYIAWALGQYIGILTKEVSNG